MQNTLLFFLRIERSDFEPHSFTRDLNSWSITVYLVVRSQRDQRGQKTRYLAWYFIHITYFPPSRFQFTHLRKHGPAGQVNPSAGALCRYMRWCFLRCISLILLTLCFSISCCFAERCFSEHLYLGWLVFPIFSSEPNMRRTCLGRCLDSAGSLC